MRRSATKLALVIVATALATVPAFAAEPAGAGKGTPAKIQGAKATTAATFTAPTMKSSTTKAHALKSKGAATQSTKTKTTTPKSSTVKSGKSASAPTKTKTAATNTTQTSTAAGKTKKSTSTASTATSGSTTAASGGTTGTASNAGTWVPTNPVAQKLSTKVNLLNKVMTSLPAGTDLNAATAGFKNSGQFLAAVNVSNNLGIAFADLKAAMTGIDMAGKPTATGERVQQLSLGQAIQQLSPGVDANNEAQKAQTLADQEIVSPTTSASRKGKSK